jgi:hypothetical protein
VEILPGKPDSPVAPFLSLVLNVNVRTLSHVDGKDFMLCLILVIGEFTGGGLVFAEQGLVVEARNGDFIAFHSGSTTHFNLKYQGERASMVFHTDKGFLKWRDSRNGWAGHRFFH